MVAAYEKNETPQLDHQKPPWLRTSTRYNCKPRVLIFRVYTSPSLLRGGRTTGNTSTLSSRSLRNVAGSDESVMDVALGHIVRRVSGEKLLMQEVDRIEQDRSAVAGRLPYTEDTETVAQQYIYEVEYNTGLRLHIEDQVALSAHREEDGVS
jgi:hypothetical protein